jgi:hypothetical protein
MNPYFDAYQLTQNNTFKSIFLLIFFSDSKTNEKKICSSWILSHVAVLSAVPIPYPKLGMYPNGLQNIRLFWDARLKRASVNMTGVKDSAP